MYVIVCGNFVGCRTWRDRNEAQETADMLTEISGRKWEVRELMEGAEKNED